MDKIRILHEDNHVLAAVKPVFMLSQADRSGKPDMVTELSSLIKVRDKKPGKVFMGLVHRLDQPVSGVMLFAKTSKAAKRLAEQFRTKSVVKHYLALVHGVVPAGVHYWHDYLSSKKKNGRYRITHATGGRSADLLIRRLAVGGDKRMSLVHIQLLTGRSHQIRVQCQSRAYPLVGDRRYGFDTVLDLNTPSIALFAESITFLHPVTKVSMRISALPKTPVFTQFQNDLQSPLLRASADMLAEKANQKR